MHGLSEVWKPLCVSIRLLNAGQILETVGNPESRAELHE